MSNLGNFAAGAVQGYQSQERLNIAQQEQANAANLAQRRMAIAEEDQAAQRAQREREKQMRDASAALFKKYYGEREEVIGETPGTDENGGQIKIPTVRKKLVQPGMDPAVDEKWAMEHAMLAAQHSGMSMEEMGKIYNYVDTARRTKAGKGLDLVLSGDTSGMKDFLEHIGKDPKGARLDRRPAEGVQQIVLANGETVDLKRAAAATATAAYYQRMLEDEKQAQNTQHNLAQTADIAAQGELRKAQATVIPSEIAKNNAQAAHAYAQASAAGEVKKSAQAERELKTVAAILEKNYPSSKGADGEVKTHPARQYVEQAVLAAKPGQERQTAASAMARVDAVAREAKQRVMSLPPEVKKQNLRRIGGMSDSDLVNFYINAGLSN